MDNSNCRLCLTGRRRMRNVFSTEINGVSYSDMIMEISNIMLFQDKKRQFSACLCCTNKVKEFYDFKRLIESNNAQFQTRALLTSKPIFLDYIEEINTDNKPIKLERLESNNKENITFIEEVKVETSIHEDENINENDASFDETGENISDIDDHLNDGCDASVSLYDVPIFGELLKDFQDDPEDKDYIAPTQKKNKLKSGRKQFRKNEYKKVLVKPTFDNNLELLKLKRPKKTIEKHKKRINKEKKSICQYCGVLSTNIEEHTKVHNSEKEYKCDICNRKFSLKTSLVNHKKRHDPTLRTHKCDKCVASFFSYSDLKKHSLSHTEEFSLFCKICKKGFARVSNLNRHEFRHNLSNRNVECEVCNKLFFDKVGLRHHMRTHTGFRPYECKLCNIPYSFKHDFNRHCLKHHGVFFERRSDKYLDEEVLAREKRLVQQIKDKTLDLSTPPFDGLYSAEAFKRLLKAVADNRV